MNVWREWCRPMRDPAATRCPESLTTTQPRGGRCAPVPVPAHWLLTSTSSVCAVAP